MKKHLILSFALAVAFMSYIDAVTIDITKKVDTFTATTPIKKELLEDGNLVSYSAQGMLQNATLGKTYKIDAGYDQKTKYYAFSVGGLDMTEARIYAGFGTAVAASIFYQLEKAYNEQK